MKKPFTPEEQRQLDANPYTYKVSATTISFTVEFNPLDMILLSLDRVGWRASATRSTGR